MARFDQTANQQSPFGYDGEITRRNPELAWVDPEGRRHLTLIKSRTVVGAAPNVDLVIADPAVSRIHAELDPQADGLWVRDLGSRNGTFVEGVRVGVACIPEGGRLRIGGAELSVSYAPAPTPVELWPSARFGPVIGPSAPMRELFARLGKIAGLEVTVLLQGETGTGKELVARAMHEASGRAGEPFVVVDCGALPDALLEAELFGHARGAFTGAVEARAGAIEAAEGGTVFLDEVGELPLAMQPKLLRVLESREVRRLGETHYRPVNVRIISATHRDLRTMVNTRGFREDLYFRLAVVPVTIPPLRERPGDIAALVQHFLPADAAGTVSPDLIRELQARPWYGNVRELRNFVERALALGPREALALSAEPDRSNDRGAPPGRVRLPEPLLTLPYKQARERALDDIERDYVEALLRRHGRNITAAAEAAGLNRQYLHRLISKHEL